MVPQVLVLGATGYVGGDALTLIVQHHPDWEVTCMVRNSDKGAKVAKVFARVRLVYGDLDSIDLLEEEASKADIIYQFANSDHINSAQAIVRGLARQVKDRPCFWIHTSGSFVLSLESHQNQLFGEATSKVYNDWGGIDELISIPSEALHRPVDEIVLKASEASPHIKTAIVCPPTIYGVGRGPDNQRSHQVYIATELFLRNQRAFQIGKGENQFNQVHIHDLSRLYLLLGEAAAAGGPPGTWNEQGYYLAENGEFVWGDILHEIAKIAHKKGFLASDQVASLSASEAAGLIVSDRVDLALGSSSRGTSIRARKLLGWDPKEKPLKDEIAAIVDSEAGRLGLSRGHAEKVLD